MATYNLTALKKAQTTDVDPVAVSTSEIDKDPAATKVASIEISGPMSHMFTEALQKLYSLESYGMDVNILLMAANGEEDTTQEEKDMYVYCSDGDLLDETKTDIDANHLKVALDNKKYKKVALVLNSINTNACMERLDNYARAIGATVYYRTSTAAKSVASIGR